MIFVYIASILIILYAIYKVIFGVLDFRDFVLRRRQEVLRQEQLVPYEWQCSLCSTSGDFKHDPQFVETNMLVDEKDYLEFEAAKAQAKVARGCKGSLSHKKIIVQTL